VSDPIYVLDSSAVLAKLFKEPIAETFDFPSTALIGSVQLAEIVTKLQERGAGDEMIDAVLGALQFGVEPLDEAQAVLAGKLRALTRSKGLSLGDRACIALAMVKGSTVVTTDRVWTDLDLPVPVLLIR
jgi:ribonuclease VapC